MFLALMLFSVQLWLCTAPSSHHMQIEFLPRHPFLPGLPACLLTARRALALTRQQPGSCTRHQEWRHPGRGASVPGLLQGLLRARCRSSFCHTHPATATSGVDLCNGLPSCHAPLVMDPLTAAMASGRDPDSRQAVPDEDDKGPDVKAVQAHYLRSPSPSR